MHMDDEIGINIPLIWNRDDIDINEYLFIYLFENFSQISLNFFGIKFSVKSLKVSHLISHNIFIELRQSRTRSSKSKYSCGGN